MRRILITGAGGFVGHHVLEHALLTTDAEIVALDSFRHRGKTDRLREVLDTHATERDRVTVLLHDLRAPISTQLDREIGPVDVVLNLASESHVDRSITDPRPFVENNVALMLSMLEWARNSSIESFIQVSTDEVYGAAPPGHNHVEWEPHLPSNPYSASKSAQESLAISYWRTYGLPLILTNTMNIIGERQDPEKFVPMVLKRVLDDEPVKIHGQPGNVGSRFYLHARNQADALLFLARRAPLAYSPGGNHWPLRFNVVGEREVDNLEMAQMIATFADRPLRWEFVDFHSTRPGHDPRYALDGGALARFGWEAPVPLEESLRRTVEWTMKHQEWLAE